MWLQRPDLLKIFRAFISLYMHHCSTVHSDCTISLYNHQYLLMYICRLMLAKDLYNSAGLFKDKTECVVWTFPNNAMWDFNQILNVYFPIIADLNYKDLADLADLNNRSFWPSRPSQSVEWRWVWETFHGAPSALSQLSLWRLSTDRNELEREDQHFMVPEWLETSRQWESENLHWGQELQVAASIHFWRWNSDNEIL